MRTRAGARIAALCVLGLLGGTWMPPAAAAAPPAPPEPAAGAQAWIWPLGGFRLAAPYVEPAHRFGAGHRGIDLTADEGLGAVRAPAAGTVAFSGSVAGRGILTIDHRDGLVTTLEPVSSALEAGAQIARGEVVATLSAGGHAATGTLHFGVRLDGEYINPMLLLGGVPRAVLLPCC